MRYGYFDDANREYVITRPDTPRPWSNYLGSAEFGAVITNHAAAYTFYKSAAQGRLTRFRFNSIPADMPGKFVYVRDAESGDFWTNGWQPATPTDDLADAFSYECRHGAGYTAIRSECGGIRSEVTYFIPLGATYEVWRVTVANTSSRPRRLSVFPFIELQCNWNALDDGTNLQYTQYISRTAMIDGMIDMGSNVNMPVDPEHFQSKDQKRHTFFALSMAEPDGFDADLTEFIGPYGTYAAPRAVVDGVCSGSTSAGDNPCAAFQVDIELEAGESRTFAVLFGVGQAEAEGTEARAAMGSVEAVDAALADVRAHWHSRLDGLAANTPDASLNSMVNMWAPYNNLMTFYWSRAASMVYAGERDGLGFRDSLQDLVGTALLITEETRERLELMLTGQLSNGGALPIVKPFAHRPGHEPEPDHYRADDCLWFFDAIPAFVKETGDIDFYRLVLPYADGDKDTVLGHLRRAMEFNLARRGAHGLPCGLSADWNDCLRLGEAGESVFVAFQLRLALSKYVDIAERLGEGRQADWARAQLSELDENLEAHAWDGEWYLRAYRYDGLTFGSRENSEGRIFMNAQTWAVLSGHATGERARQILDAMHKHLATDFGIMLCTPPYVTTDPQIALARLFNPGMKENGAIFNHTQGWAVLAEAMLGRGDRAWEYLRNVMPASFNDRAEVRQVEPYVVCQSTHSRFSPRFGSGRVSWLSGSAVWNYVAMTQGVLGIKPDHDGLRVAPCIPRDWPGFEVKRRFRDKQFDITVTNGGAGNRVVSLSLNGTALPSDLIPMDRCGIRNAVDVRLA